MMKHPEMKKKIVFTTHLYHPAKGGAENWMKQIAEILLHSGYDVKVLTSNAYSTEAFFLKDKRRIEKKLEIVDGVEVIRFGFSRSGRKILNILRMIGARIKYPFRNFLRIYSYGPRNRHIYSTLLKEEPDLIITSPMPMLNILYGYRAARKLKKPFICIPCFHLTDRSSYYNKIFFKIMKKANAVIALTKTESDFFAGQVGVEKKRIFLIPPAVEAKKIEKKDRVHLKKKFKIKEDFVLLHLGQHGRHKNILSILNAMTHLWRRRDDIALVIAGGISGYTDELKREAEKKRGDVNAKIYFFDNFNENIKSDLYSLSDVFISLSDFESFGIVFIEAMQSGLPVIGSRNSIVKSIVRNFNNGFLVDWNNSSEVSGAILELIEDKELRSIYSDNSVKIVSENYNTDVIKEKWTGVIKYVLNRSGR